MGGGDDPAAIGLFLGVEGPDPKDDLDTFATVASHCCVDRRMYRQNNGPSNAHFQKSNLNLSIRNLEVTIPPSVRIVKCLRSIPAWSVLT